MRCRNPNEYIKIYSFDTFYVWAACVNTSVSLCIWISRTIKKDIDV